MALASAMAERPGEFVGRLMEANLPLAARCAASLGETLPDGQKKALQDALIARQRDGGADLRARIAAGLALGHLGDPRFEPRHGPHGDYLLPPLVSIPGGVYGIGDDKGNYDDEKPAHRAEIKPFQIGQFAVTNAEYRRFVEAGGYEQEQWWETEAAKAWQRGEGQVEGQKQTVRDNRAWYKTLTEDNIRARVKQNRITSQQAESWLTIRNWSDEEFEAALEEALPSGEVYRLPRYWSDPDYNNPAQPVVGVCWHEARAYCAWLSAQTGRPYRLPTEVEWEAAARGLPGRFSAARAFAYGGKFDAARCNTFESHIRRTTPVGVFPGGDTSEGVADLCGNTWDWTSSAYQPYPYRFTPEREDPARTDVQYRVVRGGSWNNGQNFARAVVRDGYDPVVRYANFGFRVVVAAVPIDHL
jgi:formylglycine-generating enzyme required for sulfatase activity